MDTQQAIESSHDKSLLQIQSLLVLLQRIATQIYSPIKNEKEYNKNTKLINNLFSN